MLARGGTGDGEVAMAEAMAVAMVVAEKVGVGMVAGRRRRRRWWWW